VVNIAPPLPHFAPQNPPFQAKRSSKYINNPRTVLNVRKSPKFPRHAGNQGRGTWRWCHILNRKWKYSRFAHAHWKICNIILIIYYRNSSVVVDLLWGRHHVPKNVFLVRNKFSQKGKKATGHHRKAI